MPDLRLRRLRHAVFCPSSLPQQECRAHQLVPQSCFIYCPSCRFELCLGGEWLGQEVTTMHEAYRCNQCGTLSTWDFDTYPVPVRVEVDQ